MENIINAQRQFFNSNITKPIEWRIAQLRKLKDLLLENGTLLDEAIRKDFGKGRFETLLSELFLVFDDIDCAVRELQQWAAPQPVEVNALNTPATAYIIPEPLGVSLVIGPWNYPYQLSLAPMVAAMAAGCTVILKPSELTENSSNVLATLLNEAFDPAYIKVVLGGVNVTTELLQHKFDKIFFTGSVPVGKIIYQAAAKYLTPVTLELGGKSPVIVTSDSDLELSVKRIVWAKFLNSGQTCIAPDYVLVDEQIKPAFIEQLKKEISSRDYSLQNQNYVQIINEKNHTRLLSLIDPEKVVFGGEVDQSLRYIAPTVLDNISWEDKVMQEEIFGPILPILGFDDLQTAIAEIKARPKPLALYLFTADEAVKAKVLNEISFGGGCVNDAVMHISNAGLPFGGVGDSGIGNYHGIYGFKAFSHYKSILDKPFVAEPEIKYSPYTTEKIQILESFIA